MIEELVRNTSERIGDGIRTARKDAGRTLIDVARATNLSEGFLSKLERGQASCSIANLIQICAVLGVVIEDLFKSSDALTRTRVTVHRAVPEAEESLKTIESTGYRFRHLAGGGIRDELEVFYLVFPVDHRMESLVSHPGQEYCYVLKGEIEFVVGDEMFQLSAGDGIQLDSNQPHLARNVGPKSAHVLMTIANPYPGESTIDWWRSAPRG